MDVKLIDYASMLDDIANEKKLRWDQRKNKIANKKMFYKVYKAVRIRNTNYFYFTSMEGEVEYIANNNVLKVFDGKWYNQQDWETLQYIGIIVKTNNPNIYRVMIPMKTNLIESI